MSRSKEIRRQLIESGSTWAKHSTNQMRLKKSWEEERRFFGSGKDKTSKARARKIREQKFMREFYRRQFERSFLRVFNGSGTFEETQYVLKHFADYERLIERRDGFELTTLEIKKPE